MPYDIRAGSPVSGGVTCKVDREGSASAGVKLEFGTLEKGLSPRSDSSSSSVRVLVLALR